MTVIHYIFCVNDIFTGCSNINRGGLRPTLFHRLHLPLVLGFLQYRCLFVILLFLNIDIAQKLFRKMQSLTPMQ